MAAEATAWSARARVRQRCRSAGNACTNSALLGWLHVGFVQVATAHGAWGCSHDFCGILEYLFFFLRRLFSLCSGFAAVCLPLCHGTEQEDVIHRQLSFQTLQLSILSLFMPKYLCDSSSKEPGPCPSSPSVTIM